MVCMFWVAFCLVPHENQAIYRFHEAADPVLEIMFPNETLPTPMTLSYLWGEHMPGFADLDDLYELFKISANLPDAQLGVARIGEDNIDSYWFVSMFSPDHAATFLKFCEEKRLVDALKQLNTGPLTFRSILEKALFQRDIYQTICLVKKVCLKGCTSEGQALATEILDQLHPLFFKLRLTHNELVALKAMRPKHIDRQTFRTELKSASSLPYLPELLVKEDPRWYRVPFEDRAPQHFKDFQGRSFFKIYIKMPGMTAAEIPEFWKSVFDVYGEEMNISGRAPKCPPMTETLLIRTFGVFLEDGTYTDSGFPEVVLLRIFKTSQPKMDMSTADFRGTIAYVYAMKRKELLAHPERFGLVEVPMDHPSFYGFYSGAPDYRNSYVGALTTVRHKCINCHSPLYHGTPTIFSFARKPPGKDTRETDPKSKYDQFLIYTNEKDFYILNTPEYRDLMAGKDVFSNNR